VVSAGLPPALNGGAIVDLATAVVLLVGWGTGCLADAGAS